MKKLDGKLRNKPLSGVTCFVETKNSDGSDASKATTILLQNLGAAVESSGIRMGLSHFIWSNGNINHVKAAQFMDIIVVTPLWVKCCYDAGSFVDETDFLVIVDSLNGRHLPPSAVAVESVSSRASALREPDSPFFSSRTRIQKLQPNIPTTTKETIVLDNSFPSTSRNTNRESTNNSIRPVIPVPSFTSVDKSNNNISTERVIANTSFPSTTDGPKRRSERLSEIKSPSHSPIIRSKELVQISADAMLLKSNAYIEKDSSRNYHPPITADTELTVIRESAVAAAAMGDHPPKKRKSHPNVDIENESKIKPKSSLVQDKISENCRNNPSTARSTTTAATSLASSSSTTVNDSHSRNTRSSSLSTSTSTSNSATAATSTRTQSTQPSSDSLKDRRVLPQRQTSRNVPNQPVLDNPNQPTMTMTTPPRIPPTPEISSSRILLVQSSSSSRNSFKIALSGYHTDDRILFTSIIDAVRKSCGWGDHIAEDDPSSDCSIVIAPKGEDCRRTLRILFCLSRGVPVVSEEWLFASLEATHWVNPYASLVHSTSGAVGWLHPRFSARCEERVNRLDDEEKRELLELPLSEIIGRIFFWADKSRLLTGRCVYLDNEESHKSRKTSKKQLCTTTSQLPPLAVLCQLVALCGGEITGDASRADVHLKLDDESNKNGKSVSPKINTINVTCKEFFDAIERGSWLSIHKLYSKASNAAAAATSSNMTAAATSSNMTAAATSSNMTAAATSSNMTAAATRNANHILEGTKNSTAPNTTTSTRTNSAEIAAPPTTTAAPAASSSRRNSNNRKPTVTKKFSPTSDTMLDANSSDNTTEKGTPSEITIPISTSTSVRRSPVLQPQTGIDRNSRSPSHNTARSVRRGGTTASDDNNTSGDHSKENDVSRGNAVSSSSSAISRSAPHTNKLASTSSNASTATATTTTLTNQGRISRTDKEPTTKAIESNKSDSSTHKRKHPIESTSSSSSITTATATAAVSNLKRLKTNSKLLTSKLSTNKSNFEFNYDDDEDDEWEDVSRYAKPRNAREPESPSF